MSICGRGEYANQLSRIPNVPHETVHAAYLADTARELQDVTERAAVVGTVASVVLAVAHCNPWIAVQAAFCSCIAWGGANECSESLALDAEACIQEVQNKK